MNDFAIVFFRLYNMKHQLSFSGHLLLFRNVAFLTVSHC